MSQSVYIPVEFGVLPGWADDDHAAALGAFVRSLAALDRDAGRSSIGDALLTHCRSAAELASQGAVPSSAARDFFEKHFRPHRVAHEARDGLLTGYYEPVLDGRRQPSDNFPVPLLRRPPDLVTLVDDALRGAEGVRLTHGRKDGNRVVAYPIREEIECGALDHMGLAFTYLADPVDAFFLHVQGSGLIAFDDGTRVRVGYDGKNGHPYSSVGQYVIGTGQVSAAEMTLDRLKDWLREDASRGRRAMWINKSYIFFREIGPEAETATLGAREIPLTMGRSLAVDAGRHALGLPVYLSVPGLAHAGAIGGQADGFHRLMVAQDVGSAITGPERGDIFYGTGDEAGVLAGSTKHRGNFFVLLPRPVGEALAQ
jgi:peptidoglycan lytic transglycosylase A